MVNFQTVPEPSCGGCKAVLSSNGLFDESEAVHDNDCLFYKPEPPTFYSLQSSLLNLVAQWEAQAGKFFLLAEQERDPVGKKFYQSSAMAHANCATSATNMLAPTEPQDAHAIGADVGDGAAVLD
jgi:hypothetical protein